MGIGVQPCCCKNVIIDQGAGSAYLYGDRWKPPPDDFDNVIWQGTASPIHDKTLGVGVGELDVHGPDRMIYGANKTQLWKFGIFGNPIVYVSDTFLGATEHLVSLKVEPALDKLYWHIRDASTLVHFLYETDLNSNSPTLLHEWEYDVVLPSDTEVVREFVVNFEGGYIFANIYHTTRASAGDPYVYAYEIRRYNLSGGDETLIYSSGSDEQFWLAWDYRNQRLIRYEVNDALNGVWTFYATDAAGGGEVSIKTLNIGVQNFTLGIAVDAQTGNIYVVTSPIASDDKERQDIGFQRVSEDGAEHVMIVRWRDIHWTSEGPPGQGRPILLPGYTALDERA